MCAFREAAVGRSVNGSGGRVLRHVRVPAAKVVRGVSLSVRIVEVRTHYWRGRTVPCVLDDCPACEESTGRWYGFLPTRLRVGESYGPTVLVELPASATETLLRDASMLDRGEELGLLGVAFSAWRKKGGRSPVVIDEVHDTGHHEAIPRLEVFRTLAKLWKCPPPPVELDGAQFVEAWQEQVRAWLHVLTRAQ